MSEDLIASATFDSPLGPIALWEEAGALTRLTIGRKAPRESQTELLAAAKAQLAEYFQRQRRDFDLPLAAKGSDFEHAVWRELCAIPYGQTRSYGALAKTLENSLAASRAVGAACGSNPIAIIQPCHRVLAAGGASGGFSARGGVETKFFLLQLEGATLL